MWIKLHTELEHHPKLLKLQSLTKWDPATSIGKLITLWCWTAQYAEDGDLRPHGLGAINRLLGLRSSDKVLLTSKLLDKSPYLRIHDWWDYFGIYLQTKYRRSEDKWKRIRDLYTSDMHSSTYVVHDSVRNISGTPIDSIDSIDSVESEHKRANEAKKNQDARAGGPDVPPATRETAGERLTPEEIAAGKAVVSAAIAASKKTNSQKEREDLEIKKREAAEKMAAWEKQNGQ